MNSQRLTRELKNSKSKNLTTKETKTQLMTKATFPTIKIRGDQGSWPEILITIRTKPTSVRLKKTTEIGVSSNEEINANKRTKILVNEQQKPPTSKGKNKDNITEIKEDLENNWNKLQSLEENIAELTKLIKTNLNKRIAYANEGSSNIPFNSPSK